MPTKLHEVTHAPGEFRETYCGPAAVSAITGRTAECASAWINFGRGYDKPRKVKSTGSGDLATALRLLGYLLSQQPQPEPRVTVAKWLRQRNARQRTSVWLILAGHHWFVVRGNLVVDNVRGRVTLSKGPKRRAFVTEAYHVTEMAGASHAAVRRRRSDTWPPGFEPKKAKKPKAEPTVAEKEAKARAAVDRLNEAWDRELRRHRKNVANIRTRLRTARRRVQYYERTRTAAQIERQEP